MRFRLSQEQGFVSLLTCVLISLLLMIITLSVIGLETMQLRKSEDAEQSVRAYYAAESGIENAVSKVLSGQITSGTQTCGNAGSANTGFDATGSAGWTCQQISFTGNPTGRLDQPDQAKTIDPGTSSQPYSKVLVAWNQSQDATAADYDDGTLSFPCNNANCPNGGSWTYAAPPVELSVVQYPSGGFSASQVCNANGQPAGCNVNLGNVLFVPTRTGGVGGGTKNYSAISGGGPVAAHCAPLATSVWPAGLGSLSGTSVGYNCYAILTNLNASGTYSYLFRLRSRYTATTYQMMFLNNSNSVVTVPNGMATIDVTARAGQAYRRVVSELPLGTSAAPSLNYVMYSDTNVCKNFDVVNGIAQAGCPY